MYLFDGQKQHQWLQREHQPIFATNRPTDRPTDQAFNLNSHLGCFLPGEESQPQPAKPQPKSAQPKPKPCSPAEVRGSTNSDFEMFRTRTQGTQVLKVREAIPFFEALLSCTQFTSTNGGAFCREECRPGTPPFVYARHDLKRVVRWMEITKASVS